MLQDDLDHWHHNEYLIGKFASKFPEQAQGLILARNNLRKVRTLDPGSLKGLQDTSANADSIGPLEKSET